MSRQRGAAIVPTRRSFVTALTGGLLSGCGFLQTDRADAASGVRLVARPGNQVGGCEPGVHSLGLRQKRDALFYVPKSASADQPARLVVYLHGATGSEQQGIKRLGSHA